MHLQKADVIRVRIPRLDLTPPPPTDTYKKEKKKTKMKDNKCVRTVDTYDKDKADDALGIVHALIRYGSGGYRDEDADGVHAYRMIRK